MSKAAELASLIGNINAGGGTSGRNLIVNGAMNVAQRGTSFTTAANGAYTLDQFRYGKSNDGEVTITQDSSAPNGFANSLKVDVTTADTSIAAGQYADLFARVEAQNLQLLKFGTPDAQNFTLSFYVKSNKTGTYSVNIGQNDNSYKQANLNYTINSANTWERKSLTFTGDTAGVIDDNADRGLEILWWLAAGSTYTSGSASGTFSSFTNANHAAGHAVNLLDSTSNNWYLTGVQLEVGQNPTEFEHEPYERTLLKCQRYFYAVHQDYGPSSSNYSFMGSGIYYTSSNINAAVTFPVAMRAIPTATVDFGSSGNQGFISYTNNSLDYIGSSAAINMPSIYGTFIQFGDGSGTGGHTGMVATQYDDQSFSFSAEL